MAASIRLNEFPQLPMNMRRVSRSLGFLLGCGLSRALSALALATPSALLGWLGAALLLSPTASPQDADTESAEPKPTLQAAVPAKQLAAAQDASRNARLALEAAEDALAALVTGLEDEHHALATGSPARDALLLGLTDALDVARLRYQHELDQGRPLQRGLRRKLLLEAFASSATSSDPELERLQSWVRRRVADNLSVRTELSDTGREDVDRALLQVLPPDETFAAFWNRDFHQTLPEAEVYTAALSAYEAAGAALDRVRYPERYGPSGKPAPAGMVVVPGGTYRLGPGTGWRRGLVSVKLEAFAIDRREVTNQLYAIFVDTQSIGARSALLPRGWTLDAAGLASYPSSRRDHPVVHVNWEQAAAYAKWAGKRLPTEDEWEAAAAGTKGVAYPWGNSWIPEAANGAGYASDTLPVASFFEHTSPTGCHDMAGNVWEWTSTSEAGRVLDEPSDEALNMIIRGGAWDSPREELTTRARWTAAAQGAFDHPDYARPIGFRCVQDL
ncbi:MAG: hypothetical protein DHS20C15_27730 [Planctomycetota bacterium]|nr:MAG: hypothetical protein DHS20C15_27730 [Planctomycetota bacterium]